MDNVCPIIIKHSRTLLKIQLLCFEQSPPSSGTLSGVSRVYHSFVSVVCTGICVVVCICRCLSLSFVVLVVRICCVYLASVVCICRLYPSFVSVVCICRLYLSFGFVVDILSVGGPPGAPRLELSDICGWPARSPEARAVGCLRTVRQEP